LTRIIIISQIVLNLQTSEWEIAPMQWIYQLGLQAPHVFVTWYMQERKRCTWNTADDSAVFSMQQMNQSQSEVDYLGDRSFVATWQSTLKSRIATCVMPKINVDGSMSQLSITRFGPFDVPPGKLHYILLLLPRPADLDGQLPFLVETFDGILKRDNSSVPYPPVHPHHSALRIIGHRPQDVWSRFPAFPYASSWSDVGMRGGVSSNIPGFVPDMRCERLGDPNACFYVKMPPGTGIEHSPNLDWWTDTMVNDVSREHTHDIFLEFGRKWKHVKNGTLRRVWVLDFCIAKNGNALPYLLPAGPTPSVAWQSYQMPGQGQFLASYFHTHGQTPSELWVLEGLRKLPALFGDNMSAGIENIAHLLPSEVTMLAALREFITSNRHALRCRFRSSREWIKGSFYSRGGLRYRRSQTTCDNWAFDSGTRIILIAVNHATEVAFAQHSRWWVLTALQ